MKHINTNECSLMFEELFNIDQLDLLTTDEKKFNKTYVNQLNGYADGKVDGVKIRALTAGAATIVKRQQSRSAVAMLKLSVMKAGSKVPLLKDE